MLPVNVNVPVNWVPALLACAVPLIVPLPLAPANRPVPLAIVEEPAMTTPPVVRSSVPAEDTLRVMLYPFAAHIEKAAGGTTIGPLLRVHRIAKARVYCYLNEVCADHPSPADPLLC
jgi:hypothetical protein